MPKKLKKQVLASNNSSHAVGSAVSRRPVELIIGYEFRLGSRTLFRTLRSLRKRSVRRIEHAARNRRTLGNMPAERGLGKGIEGIA